MVSVTQELDLDKLGRADELARMVGLETSGNPLSRKSQVMVAFWQLRSIATSPPTFGPLMQLLATALTAGSSTALFFGGERVRACIRTCEQACVCDYACVCVCVCVCV